MFMKKIQVIPKTRVELHIHMDGALRPETAWDLMRRKGLPLPGDGSLAALQAALTVSEPTDLPAFLRPLLLVFPAIQGDLSAIERLAREFVEDRSRDHVAYCEARFSPHLLLPNPGGEGATGPPLSWDTPSANGTATNGTAAAAPNGAASAKNGGDPPVTVEAVMDAVLRGVAAGEQSCPGTKVCLLLCCIRSYPQWSWDVLRLCEEYKDRGVVGIDIAGSHVAPPNSTTGGSYSEGCDVFQAAAAKGIHRTVHAGEDAPAASVLAAVDDLKAERIGHGYRVLEDESVYSRCRDAGMHFEVCPHSSYLTGTIRALDLPSKRHPVLRFAEDGVSYSISTDDPFLTATTLSDEYQLLRSWGLTEAHVVRANFNAALQSFLGPTEKQALLQQLREAYGVVDYTPPIADKPTKPSPNKPNITVNSWENRA